MVNIERPSTSGGNLPVSRGGFKSSINREEVTQFFRVRRWDQDDVVEHLLADYENPRDGIRAESALKRIWAVATSDGATDGRFGSAVAVSGDTILVGACLDDAVGGVSAGRSFRFSVAGTGCRASGPGS